MGLALHAIAGWRLGWLGWAVAARRRDLSCASRYRRGCCGVLAWHHASFTICHFEGPKAPGAFVGWPVFGFARFLTIFTRTQQSQTISSAAGTRVGWRRLRMRWPVGGTNGGNCWLPGYRTQPSNRYQRLTYLLVAGPRRLRLLHLRAGCLGSLRCYVGH